LEILIEMVMSLSFKTPLTFRPPLGWIFGLGEE